MTMRAGLEERLRFLGHDSSEHRVLQVASVVGNPFTAESIAFVGELDRGRAVDGTAAATGRWARAPRFDNDCGTRVAMSSAAA